MRKPDSDTVAVWIFGVVMALILIGGTLVVGPPWGH